LRFKGKNEIKVCGVRISFLHFSNEEETQPQDEINVQEPQENQPQHQQQVEEVPNFNGQNVQILYPKVL
jgi:hypothetical protein